MECADRIATMATERTLEPVRAMERYDALCAVTVRARLAERRFEITIRKAAAPDGEAPTAYGWEVLEVSVDDAAESEGPFLERFGAPEERASDPEDAYWIALEAAQSAVDSARR